MLTRLRHRLSAAIIATAMLSIATTGAALGAPAATNDAFASATVIAPSALPYVNEVDASSATTEVDEPDSDRCNSDTEDDSIWYSITPNFNGALRADTIGTDSTGEGGDLGIYTGAALNALTEIACNNELSDDSSSARVTFRVTNGTTYLIRVTDTYAHTVLHLRRVSRPSNDDFANARSVSVGSLPLTHHVSVLNATYQYTEPDAELVGEWGCNDTTDPTVWYTVRPASTTNMRVTVTGAIDTVVAVWRGTSIGSLTPIGCNDDTSVEGQGLHSNVAWRALGGVRYYIQVGGYYGQTGKLHVNIARGTPPANDNFANATTIMADGALYHVATTRDATIQHQNGEADPNDCDLGATVWYRFVAPATSAYVVDTFGSEHDTSLAVYTGTSLSTLTEETSNCSESLTFSTTMGTTYWIQVGGDDGDSGDLHVHLNEDL